MGSFGGHALPGSFFIIFALWWTVQTYRRYYRSLRKGGVPFKSTATFKCDCLCGRAAGWEIEGILKVFFTTVGLALEIFTAFQGGHFRYLGNAQHATMFFIFALSGVVDIIVNHHPKLLPKDIEYVIAALAFSVEFVLFEFHLHGRTPLDVLLHTLLCYVIASCVIISVIELCYRDNVLIPLVRSYVVLLQGLWFWQIGFILYNPNPSAVPWDGENHEHMMVATMVFAWHMAISFIIVVVIGLIVRCVDTRCCCCCRKGGVLVMGNGHGGGARYDQIKLVDNDDLNQNDQLVTNFEDSEEGGSGDETMFQRPQGVLIAD